jgi:hypothetical protein
MIKSNGSGADRHCAEKILNLRDARVANAEERISCHHKKETDSRKAARFLSVDSVRASFYSTCLKAVGEMYWNIGVPGGNRSSCKKVVSKAQLRRGAP